MFSSFGNWDLKTFQARDEFRISTSGVFPIPPGESIQILYALIICPFRAYMTHELLKNDILCFSVLCLLKKKCNFMQMLLGILNFNK